MRPTCAACGTTITSQQQFGFVECYVVHRFCARIPREVWKASVFQDQRSLMQIATEAKDGLREATVALAKAARDLEFGDRQRIEAESDARSLRNSLEVVSRQLREAKAEVAGERSARILLRAEVERSAALERELSALRAVAALGPASSPLPAVTPAVQDAPERDASVERFSLLELDGEPSGTLED